MGFGVAISLFLAILVLALANSSLQGLRVLRISEYPVREEEGRGFTLWDPDCPLHTS